MDATWRDPSALQLGAIGGRQGLHTVLSNRFRANTNVPVYISGDKDATHGAVIRVLDAVRREGIQKVSFAITPPSDKK